MGDVSLALSLSFFFKIMPGLKRADPTFLAFSGTWEGLG